MLFRVFGSFSSQTAANNNCIMLYYLLRTEFGCFFSPLAALGSRWTTWGEARMSSNGTGEAGRNSGSSVCSGPSPLSTRSSVLRQPCESCCYCTHTTHCSNRKISLQLLRDSGSSPGRCLMRHVLIPFLSHGCSVWWWTAPPCDPNRHRAPEQQSCWG